MPKPSLFAIIVVFSSLVLTFQSVNATDTTSPSNKCELRKTVLFECNPDIPERRIPAITCVESGKHEGRLIAVYDCRWNGGDIGWGNISLQICISDDNGLTWTQPDFARDENGKPVTDYNRALTKASKDQWKEIQKDANANWDCAFGDACIVSDRETGKVMIIACAGPKLYWHSRYDNPNQCVRWYSEDGGDTWTPPTRITYDILDLFKGCPLDSIVDGQFIGSGRIMQSRLVKNGTHHRLYAALSSQAKGKVNPRNRVIYSDDFGGSWNLLGGLGCDVAVPEYGDEPKCEELPDGSVLLAARAHKGNRNFNVFHYEDVESGTGNWAQHITSDLGRGHTLNACDGEIIIVEAEEYGTGRKAHLALQSFTDSPEREYVSIAWKELPVETEGYNPTHFSEWDGTLRISEKPSAYSTLCHQKDGSIGIFYEEKNTTYYDGVYANLSIEQITGGKWRSQRVSKMLN